MQQEENELGKSSIKLFKAQEKPGVHGSNCQHLGFYGAALWEASCFGKLLLVWGSFSWFGDSPTSPTDVGAPALFRAGWVLQKFG